MKNRRNQRGATEILIAFGIASAIAITAYFFASASLNAQKSYVRDMNSTESFYAGELFALHNFENNRASPVATDKTPISPIPAGAVRRATEGSIFRSIGINAASGTTNYCASVHLPDTQNDRQTCFSLSSQAPPTTQIFAKRATGTTAPIRGPGPLIIASGTAATLSWTSTNASTCTVTKSSGGSCGIPTASCSALQSPTGGVSTGNLASNETYTLTCTSGTGATSSSSIDVNALANTVKIISMKKYLGTWQTQPGSCGSQAGNCPDKFGVLHFWGSKAKCPTGYTITSVSHCPQAIINPWGCNDPPYDNNYSTQVVKDTAHNGCIGHYNGNYGGDNKPTICDERWFDYCCQGICTLNPS